MREVEIIRYLARHAGQVVSRAELLQNVWRVAAGSETRAVDVAMVGCARSSSATRAARDHHLGSRRRVPLG